MLLVPFLLSLGQLVQSTPVISPRAQADDQLVSRRLLAHQPAKRSLLDQQRKTVNLTLLHVNDVQSVPPSLSALLPSELAAPFLTDPTLALQCPLRPVPTPRNRLPPRRQQTLPRRLRADHQGGRSGEGVERAGAGRTSPPSLPLPLPSTS